MATKGPPSTPVRYAGAERIGGSVYGRSESIDVKMRLASAPG